MPKLGDKFNSYTYQSWGEYDPDGPRIEKGLLHERKITLNEAYLAIPKEAAIKFDIYMSNKVGANTDYNAYDHNGNFV